MIVLMVGGPGTTSLPFPLAGDGFYPLTDGDGTKAFLLAITVSIRTRA
jgi:hypothetical protein